MREEQERCPGAWEARFAGLEPMGLGPGVPGRLSIIVPCYNMEDYIGHCLESLVGQSLGLERMEIVVVDDASTDGTLEKLKSWEARYPENILLIPLEENMRQGGARNVGLAHSSGEFVGFLDSDDWVDPQMYAHMLSMLEADAQVDMVNCGRREVQGDGSMEMWVPPKEGILDLEVEDSPGFFLEKFAPGGLPQKVFRRSAMDRAGVWFPQGIFYEDNYFFGILQYYLKKAITLLQPYYQYRKREDSTTHRRNDMRFFDRLEVELLWLEEMGRRGLAERYRLDVEYRFVRLFFVNTLWGLLTRFDFIPEGIVPAMVETVHTHFPGWRENVLLKKIIFGPWGEAVLELLELPYASSEERAAIDKGAEILRQAFVRWRGQEQG